MPTFNGSVIASPIGVSDGQHLADAIDTITYKGWPPSASDAFANPISASWSVTLPSAKYSTTKTGVRSNSFFDDYYNRIHVLPSLIDLGNLASEKTQTFEVWNAFFESNLLSSITEIDAEGLSVTGPGGVPTTFGALESRVYTLAVSLDGPSDVDATHIFNFAIGAGSLRTLASRLILWSFAPDWTNGISERMEWLTDVIAAYDSTEQRGSARIAPRKRIEFDAFFSKSDRRRAEALLWGWGALTWTLPVWYDGQQLTAATTIGQTSIPVDTTLRDYEAGKLAAIIWDASTYEVVEISQVNANSITLARATRKALPAGSMIYPARVARLSDRVALPRWDGDNAGARVAFDLAEPVDVTAVAPATTYRGAPVLTTKPDWSGGFELEFQRKLAEVDALIGKRFVDDESGQPITLQRMRFGLASRAERESFRAMLYWMRGRARAMWIPTWENDITLTEPVEITTEAAITIEDIGYSALLNLDANRRDLRIQLTDGTVLYRRVTNAVDNLDGTESLTLDSALGRTIALDQVVQISFLALCRLDADAVELAHWTGDFSQSAMTFRGQKHGI